MELSYLYPEIKKRLWLIVLIVAFAVFTSWAVSTYVIVKVYQSTATLVLSQTTESILPSDAAKSDIVMDPSIVKVYYSIAESDSVAASVIRKLGLPLTEEKFRERLDINADYESGIIKIAARASNEKLSRDITDAFITSLKEQSTGLGLKLDMKTIDPPKIPDRPASPNIALNMLLSAVAGVFCGTLLAVVMTLREQSADEVPALKHLNKSIPVLGMIPHLKQKRRRKEFVLFQEENVLQMEAIRALRSNILNRTERKAVKKILITSARGGEGKTTFVMNLAISLTGQSRRVLLVENNGKHPTLNRVYDFYTSNTVAQSEHASGSYSVRRIFSLGIDLLFCTSKGEPDAAELDRFLQGIEKSYDYILFDCPQMLPYSDVLDLGRFAQGVIILSDYCKMNLLIMDKCIERLNNAGAKLLGLVINNMPAKKMLH